MIRLGRQSWRNTGAPQTAVDRRDARAGSRSCPARRGWSVAGSYSRSPRLRGTRKSPGVNGGAKSVQMAAQKSAISAEFFDPTIASLFGLVGRFFVPACGLRSRRAQRRSRRPEGPRVAARSVLDGREHDGTLGAGGRECHLQAGNRNGGCAPVGRAFSPPLTSGGGDLGDHPGTRAHVTLHLSRAGALYPTRASLYG